MEPAGKADSIFIQNQSSDSNSSLQSPFLFLDNDLSVKWSGANGTHIPPRCLIVIRFV
jgi:hypothetical protein